MRRPDKRDKRLRRLEVTAAGRKLVARARPIVHRVEARMTSSLSATDEARLRRWLSACAANLAAGGGVSALAYTRAGAGAPLVLLHGIGMSRRAWEPVIPALAQRFDVIAVDLAGLRRITDARRRPLRSGVSRRWPSANSSTSSASSNRMLAGNSLGGWVALELAAQRPVAAVTLLSPAGLWRDGSPRYCRISLRASRWLARHLARPLSVLVRWRLGRIVVLGQTHGQGLAAQP